MRVGAFFGFSRGQRLAVTVLSLLVGCVLAFRFGRRPPEPVLMPEAGYEEFCTEIAAFESQLQPAAADGKGQKTERRREPAGVGQQRQQPVRLVRETEEELVYPEADSRRIVPAEGE